MTGRMCEIHRSSTVRRLKEGIGELHRFPPGEGVRVLADDLFGRQTKGSRKPLVCEAVDLILIHIGNADRQCVSDGTQPIGVLQRADGTGIVSLSFEGHP
jgi:hypothetical protein